MFLVILDNSVKKKYSLEELVNQVDFKLKQNSLIVSICLQTAFEENRQILVIFGVINSTNLQ